jgi:hypothetical protein
MSVSIIYKKLCEVNLLHHYYFDQGVSRFDGLDSKERQSIRNSFDISRFIRITPTSHCQTILAGHKCLFRLTSGGFFIGVKVIENKDGTISPAVDFDRYVKFTFQLQITDPFFLNYTALPLRQPDHTIYQFNNLFQKDEKKLPYLTRFAPRYTSGEHYSSGDLLSGPEKDPDHVYMALKPTGTDPGTDLSDWMDEFRFADSGKPLHFVNKSDLVRVSGGIFNYPCATFKPDLQIVVKNRTGHTITPRPMHLTTAKAETPAVKLSVLQLDFRSLPSDFYTLTPNDGTSSFEIYLAPADFQDVFGILEIYPFSGEQNFSPLDDDGKIRFRDKKPAHPEYEIRFKNRSTFRRYFGKEFAEKGTTTDACPLTLSGKVAVNLTNNKGEKVINPMNPDISMIKTESAINSNTYKTISEIYIH